MEVVAAVQNADNAADMNGWAAPTPLDCVRTVPPEQIREDYWDTVSTYDGYPSIPLIDLNTMTVLHEDCWHFTPTYQGVETWRACINAFL